MTGNAACNAVATEERINTMGNRALSLLIDVKTSDTREERIISGIATSPTPDRMGDIVDPDGVIVAGNIPLLRDHDHTQLVGRATLGRPTSRGIPFTAQLPKISDPGKLKDRVDDAWQSIKHGLLAAVSIGFRVLESEPLRGGGLRFRSVEVLELSLVPVPAQPDAVIDAVRSGSASARANVLRSIRNAERPRTAPVFRSEEERRMLLRQARQIRAQDKFYPWVG
jgi:HK97 family phage prohead protease